jgi:hypothetical protein
MSLFLTFPADGYNKRSKEIKEDRKRNGRFVALIFP